MKWAAQKTPSVWFSEPLATPGSMSSWWKARAIGLWQRLIECCLWKRISCTSSRRSFWKRLSTRRLREGIRRKSRKKTLVKMVREDVMRLRLLLAARSREECGPSRELPDGGIRRGGAHSLTCRRQGRHLQLTPAVPAANLAGGVAVGVTFPRIAAKRGPVVPQEGGTPRIGGISGEVLSAEGRDELEEQSRFPSIF